MCKFSTHRWIKGFKQFTSYRVSLYSEHRKTWDVQLMYTRLLSTGHWPLCDRCGQSSTHQDSHRKSPSVAWIRISYASRSQPFRVPFGIKLWLGVEVWWSWSRISIRLVHPIFLIVCQERRVVDSWRLRHLWLRAEVNGANVVWPVRRIHTT